MNGKSYLAGVLTAVICGTAGYLLAQPNMSAMAGPESNGSGGFVLATPASGNNEKMVYVLRTTDPDKPQLYVYAIEGGKDIQLRGFRNMSHDAHWDQYEMGGKPDSPADLKAKWDKEKPRDPKEPK